MPFCISQGSNAAHERIYVALGANQSYRRQSPVENIRHALSAMEKAGLTLKAVSRPWRTPAWPDPTDPPFINAVAELESDLDAPALMARLHEIEQVLGRRRTVANAPRTLDLDLIDWRGRIRHAHAPGDLALPHPRASGRAFVLLPLRDIAPHWRDPVSGRGLRQLLADVPLAERRACRPAGGLLCAAAPRLKPGAT